jgi:hypothetical protein
VAATASPSRWNHPKERKGQEFRKTIPQPGSSIVSNSKRQFFGTLDVLQLFSVSISNGIGQLRVENNALWAINQ